MTELSVDDIARCFGGAVPAVVATASAHGVPNITYLSRAHRVDDERIALSNQFFSKTARNLADNPQASLLLLDPVTYEQYRLRLAYERTERRGAVFDDLREEVAAIAALTRMEDVFRLRAADVYRVLSIERIKPLDITAIAADRTATSTSRAPDLVQTSALAGRLARSQDLDGVVDAAVDGLERLGYRHVHLLLLDEEGRRLYTIASRGFDAESVGAEVVLGEGMIGMAAARCVPLRVGNLLHMARYSRSVRRSFEEHGVAPAHEVPMPGLRGAKSRIVVPALALGQLIGVVVAESTEPVAFTEEDEAVLVLVASTLGASIEAIRAAEREEAGTAGGVGAPTPRTERPVVQHPGHAPLPVGGVERPVVQIRFFAQDGSIFFDGEYLVKGVAGRILWSLLHEHRTSGRTAFTNLEVRRDPALDMPGFKDNFESRLLLLKRRLDERSAPVRIERTGRGRFRLDVTAPLALEATDAP